MNLDRFFFGGGGGFTTFRNKMGKKRTKPDTTTSTRYWVFNQKIKIGVMEEKTPAVSSNFFLIVERDVEWTHCIKFDTSESAPHWTKALQIWHFLKFFWNERFFKPFSVGLKTKNRSFIGKLSNSNICRQNHRKPSKNADFSEKSWISYLPRICPIGRTFWAIKYHTVMDVGHEGNKGNSEFFWK